MYPTPHSARPRLGVTRLALALAVLALASLGLTATASAAGTSQKPDELTFLLQLKHPRGLAKLVRAVSDPKSPSYRDYLTVEQIVRKFGAKPAAKKTTMQWLAEHGAHGELGATGNYVIARIPAGVAAKALPATGATGSSTGSVADARRVPVALRDAVARVAPLSTKKGAFGPAVQTQAGKHLGTEPGLKGTSIVLNTGTTAGCTGARTAGEPDGLNAFTPNEYLTAFGHAALHKQGFKGQGKDIAVIETDGFRKSDIETFAKCFGLPTPNLRVRPVGTSKPLPPGDETTLDLEVLTATVPKAEHIYVYEGGGGSQKELLETIAAALGSKGHHPDAISISLSQCEATMGGQIAFHETMNEVFAVADASGISVLAAAGDTGSSGCRFENEKGTAALALVSVGQPAASPYVTAVGGTNIELTKSNKIKGEMVWNDSPIAFGAGSGGPSILTVPRPWWQQGLIPGYGNGRIVPDVAGLADLVPGYAIYCTAQECRSPEQPEGGWQSVGGTSAATPLYAGGVLLADGYQAKHGAPPLGFLNPLVYEIGRENSSGKGPKDVLLDVTRGNNDLGAMLPAEAGGGHPLGCCSAMVGYDAASGWGSINVPGLAAAAADRFTK